MKRINNRVIPQGSWPAVTAMLFLLLVPIQARAQLLTEHEVATAAETWVRYVTADPRPDATINRIEPYIFDGQPAAYIVHLDGGGFCFCGADDLLQPVYLYNPQGRYDPGIPDYQTILYRIADELQHLMQTAKDPDQNLADALSKRYTLWRDLSVGLIPELIEDARLSAKTVPTAMSLNMTSMWHQGRAGPTSHSWYDTYNKMCPVLTPETYSDPDWPLLGDDENCKVGCPATAMSQVMYYWKWPNSGTDSSTVEYSYRWWPTGSSTAMQVYVDPAQCDTISSNYPWGGRLEWQGNSLVMKGYWDKSLYDKALTLCQDEWSEEDNDKYTNALTVLYSNAPNTDTDPYTVNFYAATYRWDLMVDRWEDSPSEDANDAMRTICYHAGVANASDYGTQASGNEIEQDRESLVDHFRYDSDAVVVGSPAALDTLRTDIQWLRPVIFRGSKPYPESGGHHWVVYGYNTATSQYKMNMGWGPDTSGVWWTLPDDPDLDYSTDQQQIASLAPTNVKFVGAAGSGDGSPDDPYQDIEEALAQAPDNSTLVFKAGTTNTFAANTLVIDRPLKLKGYNVIIRKQ